MANPMAHHEYTFGEYLQLEAFSNTKHEFLDGEIFAMSGGTPTHAALVAAITGQLHAQLRGSPCRVFSGDLKVRVVQTGLTTYPDLSIVCGDPKTDPESDHVVVNPRVLVEVLSKSTMRYDRGPKLDHYRLIPSLQIVLLVWQQPIRIEVPRRGADGEWTVTIAGDGDDIPLEPIGANLSVAAIYEDAGVRPVST